MSLQVLGGPGAYSHRGLVLQFPWLAHSDPRHPLQLTRAVSAACNQPTQTAAATGPRGRHLWVKPPPGTLAQLIGADLSAHGAERFKDLSGPQAEARPSEVFCHLEKQWRSSPLVHAGGQLRQNATSETPSINSSMIIYCKARC